MGKEDRPAAWGRLITSYPARLAAYGLITLVAFEVVYWSLQDRGAAWLSAENGPLELSQVACLLIAVAGITVAIRWAPIGRAALIATGAVTLYAAARESDEWIEAMLFDDAYKSLVGIPAVVSVLVVAYWERDKLVEETLCIAQRPGATLFAIGGICLCFVCQMLDRPLFWSESGLQGSIGIQKSMVEESAELFAYLLIAFSGFEVMISAWQDRAALNRHVEISTNSQAHSTISVGGSAALSLLDPPHEDYRSRRIC